MIQAAGVGLALGLLGTVAVVGARTHPSADASSGSADGLTAVYMDSQAGDWIGQGLTLFTTGDPENPISFAADDARTIRGSVHFDNQTDPYFVMTFKAPTGQALAVGSYDLAVRQGSSVPTLDVTSYGRGCNKNVGRFEITQLEYSAPGVLSRFAASFEQHCDNLVALFGEVRFNSTQPLPALAITTGTLDFASVGSTKTVTLDNPGTTVQHLSVGVHGPNPDAFHVAGDCASIAPGSSCSLDVTLVPDRPGTRVASLVILDETRQGRRSVALTGPGLPAASVSLDADPNPSSGDAITLTAVTNAPSGTVQFFSDDVLLGAAPVSANGSATLQATFAAGGHWLRATYMGSPALAITDSAPVRLLVNP